MKITVKVKGQDRMCPFSFHLQNQVRDIIAYSLKTADQILMQF